MANTRRQLILLISVDNLRSDCVGVSRERGALDRFALTYPPATPNLDRLAEGGTYFPRCFTAAPYTTASHATILTGSFTTTHGVREYFRTPMKSEVLNLFQIFKNAGFATILATDFPALIGPLLGFTRGVDYFIEEDDSAVLQTLKELRDQPVFCFWHFGSVHNPFGLTSLAYDGTEFERRTEEVARLAGVAKPDAVADEEWMERVRPPEERLLRQWYFRATDKLYEAGRYDELMNLYVRGVEYFDAGRFGALIDSLTAEGLLDDALLALTADHGEEYSERAFAHFNGLWDGIVNVPLLLRGPGIPAGRYSEELVRSADIAPTLCDFAGLRCDAAFDGCSLRPHLETGAPLGLTAFGESLFGFTDRIRDFLNRCYADGVLSEVGSLASTHLLYVRDPRWKLLLARDLGNGTEFQQLFDLAQDPEERQDVLERHPDVVARLLDVVKRYAQDADMEDLDLSPAELDRLARELVNLGYLKR